MLSNVPPGVSVSDIPGNRPEDVFIEMIAEGWRPHCTQCGGFLTLEPNEVESWEEKCSGKATKIVCRYDDGTHEEILRIIGEEFRDNTYVIYQCECGEQSKETHEPEVIAGGFTSYRTCKRCNHVNRREEM